MADALKPMPIGDYPYHLGSQHRKVTTTSPECQIWFDRGLTWLFGFNLHEAAFCFEQALLRDDACPLAAWGLAYAQGPHYNFQWLSQGADARKEIIAQTHATAKRAQAIVDANSKTTSAEKALVKAIQARYPSSTPPEKEGDFHKWNEGYADAMKEVYDEFPEDLDVAALYADAMINLTPWRLWDIRTGQPMQGSRAVAAKNVIEAALKLPNARQHAGLQHVYIHTMEMSPTPEVAVEPANDLRDLTPDCGHLRHMASHIDVLVGSYDLAVKANEIAIEVDRKWLGRNAGGTYTNYAVHNITSLVYAAMMAGASKAALAGCDRIEELLPPEFLRIKEPNMADYSEALLATRSHVLIRFGRWQEILYLPVPKDQELYAVTTSTIHYAKGIAYAAMGKIDEAEQQQKLFLAAFDRIPDSRLTFPNKSRPVQAVAKAMLKGELLYRKKDYDLAFEALTEAIALEDGLMYAEPPGWMLPVRHAAGALLLEQNQARKAAQLFAEDLGKSFDGEEATLPRPQQHPRNMWALQGYLDCLLSLGMNDEAEEVKKELRDAKKGADVDIEASCFCATEKVAAGDKESKSCCSM